MRLEARLMRARVLARSSGLPVAGLLLAMAALAMASALGDSATFDETAHLAAGLSYLERGDFRLNPEHPPLVKVWAALPLALRGADGIDYASRAWREGNGWVVGFEMLNGPLASDRRRSPLDRLGPARAAVVLLGVLHGLLVYLWARELRGRGAGLLALALFAFCPTVLAHTRLVTTDLAASLGLFLVLWCFWRFSRRPGLPRLAALTGAAGLAVTLKHSLLLVFPLLACLGAVWVLRPRSSPATDPDAACPTRAGKLAWLSAALAGALLTGWVCLWAVYGFRYEMAREPDFTPDWSWLRPDSPTVAAAVEVAREHRLLPEAYLYGFCFILRFEHRLTFLNGRIYVGGDWLYFPEAFFLKTTPGLLAMLPFALLCLARGRASPDFDLLFVGGPALAYFGWAMTLSLNIGHRHLLPVYPLAYVLVAAGIAAVWDTPLLRRSAVVLLAAHIGSGLAAFPGYLSYFNRLAGGPAEGWRFLVDSNIDWGQDLPRLKAWMDARGVDRVHLAYWGTGDPRAYGIDYRKLAFFHDYRTSEPASAPGAGDHVAVSVTLLQGLGAPSQEMARFLRRLRDQLTPVGRAGDSILIYQLP